MGFAGANHDAVAALAFCPSQDVDFSLINGQVRVKDGGIVGLGLPALVRPHNAISRQMLRRPG